MRNRTPIPRAERPPPPDFAPVPRACRRHDGWTPARQKAFVEALADTGSVSRAAAMVNMSAESAYMLRRAPGAEGFRRAWDAALDFGVKRMKDIAFERAIEGYLVPVFVGGKLLGFRRKHNDRLLMFCLRHYGEDAEGRRVTLDYFRSKATAAAGIEDSGSTVGAGAGAGPAAGAVAAASASTTIVRSAGRSAGGGARGLDEAAALLDRFEGVPLDAEARTGILAALAACAERRRALDPLDDPATDFVRLGPADLPYAAGALEPGATFEDAEERRYPEGELSWEGMGEGGQNAEIERILAGMAERREQERLAGGKAATHDATPSERREQARLAAEPPSVATPAPGAAGAARRAGEGRPARRAVRSRASSTDVTNSVRDVSPAAPPARKPRKPYKKRVAKPPFVWPPRNG